MEVRLSDGGQRGRREQRTEKGVLSEKKWIGWKIMFERKGSEAIER